MAPFPFKSADQGAAVRDIQRQLASLDLKGEPDLTAFKTVPCDGRSRTETVSAVRAFRSIKGEDDPDCAWDETTRRLLNEQAGNVFDEASQYKIDALRRGPFSRDVQPVRETLFTEAHLHHLAGHAFYGGGIRSATFNLGMLQAMAELKMLRDFDYRFTVSGGGYIGAWFSKLLKNRKGIIEDREDKLRPGVSRGLQCELEEVKSLHRYSNYLAPKTGFFSVDTRARLGNYFRNTVKPLSLVPNNRRIANWRQGTGQPAPAPEWRGTEQRLRWASDK